MKMTSILLIVLFIQETFFVFYKRLGGKNFNTLRVLSSSGWVVIAIVLLSFDSLVQIYAAFIQHSIPDLWDGKAAQRTVEVLVRCYS